MKDEVILEIERISKQYRLGVIGTKTIVHDFNRWLAKISGKEDPYLKIGESNNRSIKGNSDYVWALKDVSFTINKGDVVGIIGKNGAGKSTLLKILSKVTSPTTGCIKSRGRIASLLEVGTGFHPEMTGRENIYLNGAILGMTKLEIASKLDDIIAFSGCERYIDTPVKRYSSGMTVRLAFAVAAHLEPEILVVDEVLAVGDAEFQKKALGKMKDISKGRGRTVLFVSHNMAAVKSLCSRAIVLEYGEIVFNGGVEEAVNFYLRQEHSNQTNIKSFDDIGNNIFNLNILKVYAKEDNNRFILNEFDTICFAITITMKKQPERYHITMVLNDDEGHVLFTFSHITEGLYLKLGVNNIVCTLPKGFLNVGGYYLSFYVIEDAKRANYIEKDIMVFNINFGERALGAWMNKEPGFIKPKFKWTMC